jgi:hypothetical protein
VDKFRGQTGADTLIVAYRRQGELVRTSTLFDFPKCQFLLSAKPPLFVSSMHHSADSRGCRELNNY